MDGVIDSDKEIIARSVSLGDSQSHGTMITMRDLKFTSGDSFSLEKLKDKIKWGLTLSPVFRIYINGEEVKPKFIEDSIKFKVDKTGDEMGHLEGIVHLTPKSSENYGLYVYVKKCLVGDPRALLSEFSPKVGLEKRIIGIVNVDLNHAVLFDRSRFKEDDPGVMEMKKALGDVLRNVRNYADGEAHRKAVIDYRKNIGRRVEKVLELFMSRNILPDDTQVEIQSLEEPSLPGIYDPEGRKITLNQNHPLISVREEVVASTQALNIINIFVETIALHRAKFMDSSLDIFLSEKADLLRQINGASSKRDEQITIFPDVLYDLNGLARQTGMSIGLVREMVEGNVLPSDEDGVLGRDFLEFKNRTKGLSSLYEAISSRFPQSLSTQMIRYVEILNRIGNVAEPFVFNFSRVPERPSYFLESSCSDGILYILSPEVIDLRARDCDPKGTFKGFGDKSYTILELVEQTSGLDSRKVLEILTYAKDERIKIGQVARGAGREFVFRDFITALQRMRGNYGSSSPK